MKLTVIHDEGGNITRLAAGPTEGASAGLELRSGERMTQVEVSDTDLQDEEAIAERLSDLIDNYRFEAEGDGGRLAQRS